MADPLQIDLARRDIRAGDLASGLANPDRIVARIPVSRTQWMISFAEQQALLRRLYPGEDIAPRHKRDIVFVARTGGRSATLQGTCYLLRRDVPQGDYLAPDDFAPTACDASTPKVRIAYDKAARALYATSDLPALGYAGAVALPASTPVRAGSAMTLRTISGPVTIDRSVTTLQAGRTGKRVFVRTRDGDVVAHPLDVPVTERTAR